MVEQFISFETAILAKRKGFNIKVQLGYQSHRGQPPCITGEKYKHKDFDKCPTYLSLQETDYNNYKYSEEETWSMPTQSLLQKWLRNKHDIVVVCIPDVGMHSSNGAKNGVITSNSEESGLLDYIHGTESRPYRYVVYNKGKWVASGFSGVGFTYEKCLENGLRKGLELI